MQNRNDFPPLSEAFIQAFLKVFPEKKVSDLPEEISQREYDRIVGEQRVVQFLIKQYSNNSYNIVNKNV